MTAPFSKTHRVFGIVGWKNSGKTNLVARLITELTERGYAVSALKHAHHTFEIDHKGRDSYRFRKSGAAQVAIVSGTRWALVTDLTRRSEPDLEEVLAHLDPCDLVLIEGYKSRTIFPKIEARGTLARHDTPLAPDDPQIVAIAWQDKQPDDDLPHFHIDDIPIIADFILNYCEVPARNPGDDATYQSEGGKKREG